MLNWFYSLLEKLGLFTKKANLLLLGLDNSGKTTLLYMLKEGKLVSMLPTNYPDNKELTVGGITFNTFDLGGHEKGRKVWNQYFGQVNSVVFMVDIADPERFTDVKDVLDDLLKRDDLKNVPFLILANKSDLEEAVSENKMRAELGLNTTTGKNNEKMSLEDFKEGNRPIEVFTCSIAKNTGYQEGFEWLNYYLS